MTARRIVTHVEEASSDLRSEGSESPVVSPHAREQRAFHAFALFDGAAFVDQNRRSGSGQRCQKLLLELIIDPLGRIRGLKPIGAEVTKDDPVLKAFYDRTEALAAKYQ